MNYIIASFYVENYLRKYMFFPWALNIFPKYVDNVKSIWYNRQQQQNKKKTNDKQRTNQQMNKQITKWWQFRVITNESWETTFSGNHNKLHKIEKKN